MAKTPLFAALRRAFRQARNPEQTKPQRGSNRREFLLTSAALGSATILAGCDPPLDQVRVAVIGAGLAGLHAAYTLVKAGVNVRLYEASLRTGGRVMTARGLLAPDLYTDVGGEFIDSTHMELLSLAKEFGLELLDTLGQSENGLTRESYFFSGKHLTENQVVQAVRPLLRAIEMDAMTIADVEDYSMSAAAIALDRQPLSAYLDKIGAMGDIRKLIEVAYVTEFGLDPKEQSSLNLITLISTDLAGGRLELYGDSDERYTVSGGAQRICDELAKRIEKTTPIELGHRLIGIDEGGPDTLRLRFSRLNGGPVEVDAELCILALPFTTLQKVQITTPLSDKKRRAITELGYGQNAKLLAGFTKRIWRDQKRSGYIYSDAAYQTAWDNSRQQPGSAGGLTLFLGGNVGVDSIQGTPTERVERLLPDLDKAFPGLAATYAKKAARFHWPSFPLSRGSYSCYKPGQWTSIGGAEATPEGRLYFAGEHTSSEFQGYMEGAAESGKRAANEVLLRLGILKSMMLLLVLASSALVAAGCGGVDLGKVPYAKVGCEDPAEEALRPSSRMLPGRVCQECHRPSGQADKAPFTASGTVYSTRTPTRCDTGVVASALVEIFDMGGKVQQSMMTNAAGNFYTSAPLTLPMRVRISKDGKVAEMLSTMASGACAACHQRDTMGGAPGPIYLE